MLGEPPVRNRMDLYRYLLSAIQERKHGGAVLTFVALTLVTTIIWSRSVAMGAKLSRGTAEATASLISVALNTGIGVVRERRLVKKR
jgi:hypothetical protein